MVRLRLLLLGCCLIVCHCVSCAADEVEVVADVTDLIQDAVKKTVRDNRPPPEFLKPLVNLEVSFIKRVCSPNEDQMKAIVDSATRAYQSLGNLINDDNDRFFRAGQIRIMGPNNEQLKENPYHRVRRDAADYLKPLVSTEQYQKYRVEAKQRDEFELRAAIGIAVGLVDDKLVLTQQQREKLEMKLMESWSDADLQWVQNYVHNPQFAPQLPKQTMNEVLTPTQWKAWKTFSQVQMSMHLGHDTNDVWGEEWLP